MALTSAAAHFPHLTTPTAPDTTDLSPAEAALAVAIHRTTLQRWLTLEHLLGRYVNQPVAKLEPAMRAVLLAGAAQLLFMQRLPAYAVVDESVTLARRHVRPKAGGMVNAVLRKVGALVGEVARDETWQPAGDALPLDGGTLHLAEPCLPEPSPLDEHLAIAASHPRWLVQRWLKGFSREAVIEICRSGLRTAPTIVAVEPGFDLAQSSEDWQPHALAGSLVWRGDHAALVRFLQGHPQRRVQDPAAQRAVAATHNLEVNTILDFCAGRGTKTVQLAATHPKARILAADPDPERAASLREVAARFEHVEVVTAAQAMAQRVDLLVLDVPCSNTGVLGRRPEARYRLNADRLDKLTDLQRQILDQALPTATPGGWVLYTTCSIEPEENDRQTRWIEEQIEGETWRENLLLPAGDGLTHHDGSYHALVRSAG